MFKLDEDSRLAAWSKIRKLIDSSDNPFQIVIDFWAEAPFTTGKPRLDPFYQASWPTPWEIIVDNLYDDFSKAVMMGYTLLLTEKFKESLVEIRTLVDHKHNRLYNVVVIDSEWALNFNDYSPIKLDEIPDFCRLENLIVLDRPR